MENSPYLLMREDLSIILSVISIKFITFVNSLEVDQL